MQNFRFLATSMSWLIQPSQPFQKASSSVSSLKVTRYVAQFGIHFHNGRSAGQTEYFGLGHRRRARRKEAVLIRLASPKPR